MADLLGKIITGAIALIVLGALGGAVVTGLSGLNLSDVGGQDLSFVILILGVGFFVGVGLAVYYTFIRGR